MYSDYRHLILLEYSMLIFVQLLVEDIVKGGRLNAG